jgi:prepilin-type processing-associated H-X9-DG protein
MSTNDRAFGLADALVTVAVGGVALALLLPAVVRGSGEDNITRCLANARGMVGALGSYVVDHSNRMPGDEAGAVPAEEWINDALRPIPDSEQAYAGSWLGKIESYLGTDLSGLDCPVVDDHRKGDWWPSDYVMNRFGINTSPDMAAAPSKAVLVGEPNMARRTVMYLGEIVAWYEWGPRADLEQNQVHSLSFGFVDGHVARVAIPQVESPHLVSYEQLELAKPGDADFYSNFLWWYSGQALPAGR